MQVRCIATARVLMPKSVVRLSAGRLKFGFTDQVIVPHTLWVSEYSSNSSGEVASCVPPGVASNS